MSVVLLVAIVITFAGGIASGLAGFGFALICVPPLLLIYPPQTVVAISILLTLLTAWVVLPGVWREMQVRTVAGLLPWALSGIAVGVVLLRVLNADQIRLIASLVVFGFAMVFLRGWLPPGARTAAATGIAGMTSGIMNAMTGMAGPPVILLFIARGYETHAFRTSIVAYFLVIDMAALATLIWVGEIAERELRTALVLLPGAILGTILGRALIARVPVATFRRMVLAMVMVTGLVGVVDAARGLISGST